MRTEREVKAKLLEIIEKLNEMEDVGQTTYWLGVWKGLSFVLGLDIDDQAPETQEIDHDVMQVEQNLFKCYIGEKLLVKDQYLIKHGEEVGWGSTNPK